jgi:hypothetical protein
MRYRAGMDSNGDKAGKLQAVVKAARELEARLAEAALAHPDDDHQRAVLYEFARQANQVVLTVNCGQGQGQYIRQAPILGLGTLEARKLA